MVDILLGLLAIVAGAAMLVAGQYVLRLALPIWGFFAGFAFGAGLIADIGNDRFLGTVFGWIVGLVFGVVLALLAYFFYAVAVVLVMASFGFAIGSGLSSPSGSTGTGSRSSSGCWSEGSSGSPRSSRTCR
jgi:hypothetical protein